jgi:hypothetical protein
MVDPHKVCLFIPPELRKFKLDLFERIGSKIGRVVRHKFEDMLKLPDDILPIIGCHPEHWPLIQHWRTTGRQWCYWDRGYMRRIFATDLPRGADGGYYRWHLNAFQLQAIEDVPDDRWRSMKIELQPWRQDGNHIVVAEPSPTYAKFHHIEGWTERTVARLKELTDRPIRLRDKEMQRRASDRMPGGRRLWDDLQRAHCLVTHGSIAAVEAVVMGCPVFVDPCSAAALVGKTDLSEIENPAYPDRLPWVKSLCYCQFSEPELVNGTLWRLLK